MFTPSDIFHIDSKKEFDKISLKLFRFQYDNSEVYNQFCGFLNKDKTNVKKIEDIPFLPIQFFKSHDVLSSKDVVQTTFIHRFIRCCRDFVNFFINYFFVVVHFHQDVIFIPSHGTVRYWIWTFSVGHIWSFSTVVL